jgi:hypothetical protein
MAPGPLFASPPETDQTTRAVPPLASVAGNCSTDTPDALIALQPAQLVSILAVLGEMEKVPFEELAVAPPPHPASAISAGAKAIAKMRNANRLGAKGRGHTGSP